MTLDRVILDSFGAYAGRQEAVLAPEPGKPVILFGGMNGGGKTTLLDAIQLGFYGRRARTSNRGGLAYREYLAECIHRGASPREGAPITIEFHRMAEGRMTRFELQRSWKQGRRGVEETLRVSTNGEPDELLTEHSDESLDGYLPVGIAHLFFFDGEQIKELAEGQNAARIVGTAIQSLLGLDLVERLDGDLRVFERRKKAEVLDSEALLRLRQAEAELAHIDGEEASAAQEEGRLVNEAGRLASDVDKARETFEGEGGALFERQEELKQELDELTRRRTALEDELRELAAGALPLLLLRDQLSEIQEQVQHETSIRHNRLLVEAMEERDEAIIELLSHEKLSDAAVGRVARELANDRRWRLEQAGEELLFDAEPEFDIELRHLRENILPAARDRAGRLLDEIRHHSERIARVESDLARVPDEDRIAAAQRSLRDKEAAHERLLKQLADLRIRKEALRRQHEKASRRLEHLGTREVEARFDEEARHRMLKHSSYLVAA